MRLREGGAHANLSKEWLWRKRQTEEDHNGCCLEGSPAAAATGIIMCCCRDPNGLTAARMESHDDVAGILNVSMPPERDHMVAVMQLPLCGKGRLSCYPCCPKELTCSFCKAHHCCMTCL
eukprot:1160281-Pelagomonas_calceolata.AAC.5